MYVNQMQAIVNDLFAQFGRPLAPRVELNSRLRTVGGRANCTTNRIQIATWLLRAPESEQQDTLRHETAHILAGAAAKHNRLWKIWALRCGAKPSSTYDVSLNVLNHAAPPRVARVYFRCEAGVCEIKFRAQPRKDYTRVGYRCKHHNVGFVRVMA